VFIRSILRGTGIVNFMHTFRDAQVHVLASNSADNQPNASETLDVLLIQLASELYALPSASVREVVRYREYTPVPGAPPVLPGILNQRGAILPVVDLPLLLGLESAPPTRTTRLVVMSHNEIDMALLAERVLDLVGLPASTIDPLPTALDPARARYLRGVVHYEDQPVALLDLNELISGLRA
jgi:purine-binding chemotaxis protein CheW